jgi:hypothetical protein
MRRGLVVNVNTIVLTFFIILSIFYGAIRELEAPVLEGVIFVSFLLTVIALVILKRFEVLIPFLLLPVFFGFTPWGSPVRLNIMIGSTPIYLYDFTLILFSILSIIKVNNYHLKIFIKENWGILSIVIGGLLFKFYSYGVNSETIRNAAIFYYPIIVSFTLMLIYKRRSSGKEVFLILQKFLPVLALIPIVVIVGFIFFGKESVLSEIHQGILIPSGILSFFYFGSLILLTFYGAAFLPHPKVQLTSKVFIVLLFVYDAMIYMNRSVWVAVIAAYICSWIFLNKKKALPIFLMLVVSVMFYLIKPYKGLEGAHNNSSGWRLLVWSSTIDSILNKPLIGHSTSQSILSDISDDVNSIQDDIVVSSKARSPHNSYLSLLYYGGLFIGGSIILFLLKIVYKLYKQSVLTREDEDIKAWFRGVIAVIIYSGFNVVLESPIEGVFFWVIVISAYLNLINYKREYDD